MREAREQSPDDRYRRRGGCERFDEAVEVYNDDVRVAAHDLGNESVKTVVAALGGIALDDKIISFYTARSPQRYYRTERGSAVGDSARHAQNAPGEPCVRHHLNAAHAACLARLTAGRRRCSFHSRLSGCTSLS